LIRAGPQSQQVRRAQRSVQRQPAAPEIQQPVQPKAPLEPRDKPQRTSIARSRLCWGPVASP
jgi:hypothetical protein